MFARLSVPLALAGGWVVGLAEYTGGLTILLLTSFRGCFSSPFRGRLALYELWKIGAQSWFIASICSLFVGMVLAFQSAYQMQKLGAEIYIASLVALSIVREIGPVMTALIVAGRVGSAIAAELGTMKVTEQIDALSTLAIDPVRYLVVPRLVASMIALPLLTIWADTLGILGGFIVGTVKLRVLPTLYWKMTVTPLVVKDLASGLLKSWVFALIICVVSCYQGFRTEGGAEGVGQSTTAAVVSAFLLIIASDCVLTALFYFVQVRG